MAESILSPGFSGPTVDPDHPWLGLHPFAEENHRYFFGRTAEVRDIFLRVRENPLTVLYGQSGLGKTSLLRAGLIPKLCVERFRPVRVLLDFGEKSVPLVDQVRTALAAACANHGEDVATLIESWEPLASLWEICAHENIRPRDLADKPPVLIIDQLEEVFTLVEQQAPAAGAQVAEVAELFAQIGDLVENRAPVALQKTFQQDPRLALRYDSSPTAVRVVLSLREDYLAQLEQRKSMIPSLMRNRMPLRLLTGPQAFEAVVRPGRIDGRNLASDRVGEQIVRFVARRADDIPLEEIEAVPPLLSLVCERLNTARLEAKPPQKEISDELVKSEGTDILQRFYDESFAAFPDSQREVVREYVEDRMVTVGGHRNPVAREDAVAELARQSVSEPDNVLNALIARRLLTAERRGGIQRLEITHDVLTPLAVRGRKDRQERRDIEQAKRKQAETEAQLVRETELREEAKRKQLEAEVQLARETRLRNLFRLALAGVTVVLILALGALWWAVQEKNRADKAARIAEQKTKEASAQRSAAVTAKVEADEQKQAAVTANVNLQALLDEAARSDRVVAEEDLQRGKDADALAYLARASRYVPKSSLAAEASIPVVLSPPIAHSQATFQGHTGVVSSAVFSPDGRRVLTASEDRTARLWEADSGKLLATFEGHTGAVRSAVFSPDGRRVLTASEDGTARLWEAESGKCLATFQGRTSPVYSAVFSPDGRRVLTASWDKTARLWEAESGKLRATFQGHTGAVNSAVFSPDGRRVLTASDDGTARLWETESGKRLTTFQGHTGAVHSAVFSPDGRRVLTASEDRTARLWETESGKLLATFQGHTGELWSAVFSPDGRRVLTASADAWDNTAWLWEADSGKLLATFQGHTGAVNSAVFSPDGRRVLTASEDKTARLWEADSGELLATFQGHTSPVYRAVFSPDGRRVLTASEDKTARLWEADSGELLATFQGHTDQVNSAVFSPDGRRVLTASTDKTARLWEADGGKLLATFQGHDDRVTSAVFSPDGRRVLTASTDKTVRLWEAESGKLLATFPTGAVRSAVFSPDGRRVLTASWDKTARLWEAESGKLRATFQGHMDYVYSAVFSPDGRRVLTASGDKTARLWEADSSELLATFQGHTGAVNSAVFSPDGRRVLTASEDGTARLWETESGKRLTTFQGHTGEVWSAVFSPDGQRVLTVSADKTPRLWEADSGNLVATFQGHTSPVYSAVFSPDGRRVLTVSDDSTARLWPVLPAGVPPDWCADFLVWLGGKRIVPDGQIETLFGDELLKLEAQLRPHINEDTDYALLLRWRLLKAEERPVDPYGKTTQEQAADQIIRPEMNEYETEHAYDLDPWHPLVHLALAGFEEDPIRADFLRRYSLDRLPNDAKLRRRAAEFLRKQGKEDLAREVEVRGE